MEIYVFIYFLNSLMTVFAKGEGGCKYLVFLDCEKNKRLIGHVNKTKHVLAPGLEDCQHQCFIEDKCVSYNLGPIEGLSRSCELSDTDHVEYPNDVKHVPDFEYCAIKNPCSSNPCQRLATCKPDFYFNSFKCIDPRSCAGTKIMGMNENGVYNITPVPGYTIQVYCDQGTDGGGWTVIQKRLDGSVKFDRKWDCYKRGFGDKNGEYWLGLDAIHILTNSSENELRIDLTDFSQNTAHALYDSFRIGSESEKYSLNLGIFHGGEANDSFSSHNKQEFTTFDNDNDKNSEGNCAKTYKSGWWFNDCHKCNLNGEYYINGKESARGIIWHAWKGYDDSLKEVQMKIRPVNFKPKSERNKLVN